MIDLHATFIAEGFARAWWLHAYPGDRVLLRRIGLKERMWTPRS